MSRELSFTAHGLRRLAERGGGLHPRKARHAHVEIPRRLLVLLGLVGAKKSRTKERRAKRYYLRRDSLLVTTTSGHVVTVLGLDGHSGTEIAAICLLHATGWFSLVDLAGEPGDE